MTSTLPKTKTAKQCHSFNQIIEKVDSNKNPFDLAPSKKGNGDDSVELNSQFKNFIKILITEIVHEDLGISKP